MASIINATTSTGLVSSADNSGSLQLATNNGTTAVTIDTSQNVGIGTTSPTDKLTIAHADEKGITFKATGTDGTTAAQIFYEDTNGGTGGVLRFDHDVNSFTFATAGTTERMRIDSSGNVGIGNTSASSFASTTNLALGTGSSSAALTVYTGTAQTGAVYFADGTTSADRYRGAIEYTHSNNALLFTTDASERMRIDSSGNLLVGKTAPTPATVGCEMRGNGVMTCTRSAGPPLTVNRTTDDGDLVSFSQDGTQEGSISVSGSTVSYNGGHLSRWSQLPDNSKDDTILKGTVLSNLDDMCVWTKDGEVLLNEQLNKMQVSSVEGDVNVAGVFVNWTFDEECQSEDMNVAMTGDMIIRIAEGVVVQKGELLMSAGDGTAKPQGDDIRKSKTVAKVTSNHVTCTYADGSYCVPCVLMAC